MFEYFETTSRLEREEIAASLRRMYNAILEQEAEAWAKPQTLSAKLDLAEAIGKLGTIQGIFEVLGIPFEYGRKFEEVPV